MNREQLAQIYLDWRNNFLTITGFAEHYGLHFREAESLLSIARQCFETQHPDA
jgi:hypothetical protein